MRLIALLALAGCRFGFDELDFVDTGSRTITLVIEGEGAVVSDPPGLACVGPCSATLEGPVTLTATAAGPRGISAWNGTTCGSERTCTLDGAEDQTVIVEFAAPPVPANRAFATSRQFDGALLTAADANGGTAADRFCREAATAAGLPGTFVAYLSSATLGRDAIAQLGSSRGWVRTDDVVIASDQEALVGAAMLHAIDRDETGAQLPQTSAWSGGRLTGFAGTQPDCGGFTSTTGMGGTHPVLQVGSDLTTFTRPCTATNSLLCFQIDLQAALPPIVPFPIGRHVFTSNTPWNGIGGTAAADAHCQAEANGALPGQYIAGLATSTASIEDRAGGLDGPWRRPDGLVVTLGSLAGEVFAAPLNRTALGEIENQVVNVGATSLTEVATNNCNDWSIAGASGAVETGDPTRTRGLVRIGLTPQPTCTQRHLICLERAP